jgi:hypothetical protein
MVNNIFALFLMWYFPQAVYLGTPWRVGTRYFVDSQHCLFYFAQVALILLYAKGNGGVHFT